MAARPPLNRPRTYWHLADKGTAPSEYEIVTSRLLYYVGRGFEVSSPLAAWYAEHQQGSPLGLGNAEAFVDPRQTTYASYVALQQAQEAQVDALLASVEDSDYDRKLSRDWMSTLARVLPVMRYPVHGLQMLACYVGQMAPSGRVVVACAMQAADEVRRIQRFAYRMRQLQEVDRTFGVDAAQRWQHDAAFQPLRELVERLLITYDFGEALVALNVVVKPAIDELFMVRFAKCARSAGDVVLADMLEALHADCVWHRAWADALLETLRSDDAGNGAVVSRWVEKWQPVTRAVVLRLQPLFPVIEGAWP
jgi:toluene monooxygenase system protein E